MLTDREIHKIFKKDKLNLLELTFFMKVVNAEKEAWVQNLGRPQSTRLLSTWRVYKLRYVIQEY